MWREKTKQNKQKTNKQTKIVAVIQRPLEKYLKKNENKQTNKQKGGE